MHNLAFHRAEVDLVESNSATRDEFIFVRAFTAYRKRRGRELTDQPRCLGLAELRPRR